MANATKLFTLAEIAFTQWSRPSAENPRLVSGISATATTMRINHTLKNDAGTLETRAFLFSIRDENSYTETCMCPANGQAADGTLTGVVRGISLEGLDWTTGDASLAVAHKRGDVVACNISGIIGALILSAIQGTVATGGTGFTIGTEPGAGGETVTLYRTTTAGVKKGFLRWYITSGKTQYSEDGTTWTNIDSASASNLLTVSATDTTPGYLGVKLVSVTGGITFNILNAGANETLNLTVDLSEVDVVAGPLANICSDVTSTAAELNKLSGASANVTSTNLNTLTGGSSSDASLLHNHSSFTEFFTAYETVSTGEAVALMPIEAQWFTQLTDTTVALGDSNIRRKYSIKFIPSATSSTLTTMQIRAGEQVNGATAVGDLTISIQSDSASAPSGTAITNGTANTISQATQRTWTTTVGSRTVTWASSPTLTAGTTYWLVIECAATDAANYLKIGCNDTYVGNYLTFTRLTYNLDTTSWGSSSTTSIPFFWFDTQPVIAGMALCKTDANFGAKTWGFKGIVKTGVSAQASCDVYTDKAVMTGLTPNKPYYISETAGAITTTAPFGSYQSGTEPTAFTYKIGKSDSSTSLKINPGTKRVIIYESNISATTTRQYITWMKPEYVRVQGVGAGASSGGQQSSSTSLGYIGADGSDGSVSAYCSPDINGGKAGSTSMSLNTTQSANNKFTCAGSAFTDAGFTFVYTEDGTADVSAILEAIQS